MTKHVFSFHVHVVVAPSSVGVIFHTQSKNESFSTNNYCYVFHVFTPTPTQHSMSLCDHAELAELPSSDLVHKVFSVINDTAVDMSGVYFRNTQKKTIEA